MNIHIIWLWPAFMLGWCAAFIVAQWQLVNAKFPRK